MKVKNERVEKFKFGSQHPDYVINITSLPLFVVSFTYIGLLHFTVVLWSDCANRKSDGNLLYLLYSSSHFESAMIWFMTSSFLLLFWFVSDSKESFKVREEDSLVSEYTLYELFWILVIISFISSFWLVARIQLNNLLLDLICYNSSEVAWRVVYFVWALLSFCTVTVCFVLSLCALHECWRYLKVEHSVVHHLRTLPWLVSWEVNILKSFGFLLSVMFISLLVFYKLLMISEADLDKATLVVVGFSILIFTCLLYALLGIFDLIHDTSTSERCG